MRLSGWPAEFLLQSEGQSDSPDCVRLSGWPSEFLLQSEGQSDSPDYVRLSGWPSEFLLQSEGQLQCLQQWSGWYHSLAVQVIHYLLESDVRPWGRTGVGLVKGRKRKSG